MCLYIFAYINFIHNYFVNKIPCSMKRHWKCLCLTNAQLHKHHITTLTKSRGDRKLIAPQRLQWDLLDWLASNGYEWATSSSDTDEYIVRMLKSPLRYVDHALENRRESGCPMPKCFSFHGYNKFKKQHHRVPQLDLRDLMNYQWIWQMHYHFRQCPLLETNKPIQIWIHCFATFSNYKARLDKVNERFKTYSHKYPSRSLESDTFFKYIPGKPYIVG